ncbi:PhoX family protein [Lutimonas saemankumensis]|uniref:PhoX family protein n=1 Tax=Lutimonas saemankumensis TaxID=483016 RepID=UPI001CD49B87|nr:alkaline phosphatase PhoX [Lutimonas saemankumensis]MCA0933333.1 PhoX family protein [Lutimonas saemankumensis]
MKNLVPLILYFSLTLFGYGQHISNFDSLDGALQNSQFHLPSTHTFQILFDTQDFLDAGGVIPDNWSGPNLDFAGFVPREGSSRFGYLSINSEIAPGAVTILDIEFDDNLGQWNVDSSELVDFSYDSFEFATAANCSGTVTPWNTIISCEEYTSIELQASSRYPLITSRDLNNDGYDDFGWAVEIDPATKKIINQKGGREDKDKLWAMGNFKHENAVIRADLRTVYQGADAAYIGNDPANGGDGYLFKFIASNPKDLSDGDLYVYKGDKMTNHAWVKLANDTQEDQNSTLAQCKALDATPFGGIEDVEISPKDSLIYFAVKRESIGDINLKGVVYRFKDSDAGIKDFEIYVGGNSIYDGVEWGKGNDNLVFDDLGNLWVAQDGGDNHIWVVEYGHSQNNPKVKIFARTPLGSEPTGLTFTPDHKYIFMSIQHPKSSNEANQTDALGNSVNFNQDVTLVIARKENLNYQEKDPVDEIMISQYYHDANSESKWIELKNISGTYIYDSSYYLHLYDGATFDPEAPGKPMAIQAIPAMETNEVLLFKNEGALVPEITHLGVDDPIVSAVCDFDGDDLIFISSTPGNLNYNNRRDLLGTMAPNSKWGQNKVFIRGGNSNEFPEEDFDINNWIELDSLTEVSLADKNKNIALGTHVKGSTAWNGESWDNLEPDRSRNVEINGSLSLGGTGDFHAYDLNISEDAIFHFEDNTDESNSNVIVYGDLKIATKGSLIIGDTESLILKKNLANVTGEIEKVEKSALRNSSEAITYWSSPVNGARIEDVFKGVDKNRIFYFDQTKHLENDPDSKTYWDVWVNLSSGPMEIGKGYAAEGKEGSDQIHEVVFKGKPNYGEIETRVLDFHSDTIGQNDFNLIGNPYPSAIDIELFLDKNRDVIDGAAYFWNHSTDLVNGAYNQNDYLTYNLSGSIPDGVGKNIGSGQGFFVRSLKSDKAVFDPSMIIHSANSQFFKRTGKNGTQEKNRFWLNLKSSDNSFKQILISFSEKATDELDAGYDAFYLSGNQTIDFYSVLDNNKLAIQGLAPFNEEKVIKIGFDSEIEDQEMKIEIDHRQGLFRDRQIFLFDNENSTIHDLTVSPYYFNYEGTGTYMHRFSIVFNRAILSLDDEIEEEIKIYIQNEHLIVEANDPIDQIKIYDTLGRLLIKRFPKSSYSKFRLDPVKFGGVFIVELSGYGGKSTARKMIKY